MFALHDVYAVAIEKKDSYGLPKLVGHAPLLYSKVISMFLILPNISVEAEVVGEIIKRGGSYGLEIPVSVSIFTFMATKRA